MMDMLLQDDDRFVVSGQVYIVDGKGIYLGHLLQLTPSLVKYEPQLFIYKSYWIPFLNRKATALIQKSYPMRLKAFHIINMLPIFNLIFKFFYSMLSRKLKKRVSLDKLTHLKGFLIFIAFKFRFSFTIHSNRCTNTLTRIFCRPSMAVQPVPVIRLLSTCPTR